MRITMRKRISLALLGIALLGAAPALAQSGSAASPGSEPDGAPRTHHPQYVAPTGVRKPPGEALDDRKGLTPLLEQRDKEIKDHTLKSICQGASGCEGGHLRK